MTAATPGPGRDRRRRVCGGVQPDEGDRMRKGRVRWDAVVSRILTESPRDHRDGCYNVAWNRETVCWYWCISRTEYQKMEKRMREIS